MGYFIFLLGIVCLIASVYAQEIWGIFVIAVAWWIMIIRSTKRAKEKRLLVKRLRAVIESDFQNLPAGK